MRWGSSFYTVVSLTSFSYDSHFHRWKEWRLFFVAIKWSLPYTVQYQRLIEPSFWSLMWSTTQPCSFEHPRGSSRISLDQGQQLSQKEYYHHAVSGQSPEAKAANRWHSCCLHPFLRVYVTNPWLHSSGSQKTSHHITSCSCYQWIWISSRS